MTVYYKKMGCGEMIKQKLRDRLVDLVLAKNEAVTSHLADYDVLRVKIRPGDVLVSYECNRIGRVINKLSNSPWTHCGLYIGKPVEIEDTETRALVKKHYKEDEHDALVIEANLASGVKIHSLEKYKDEHVRICRPKGLSHKKIQKVLAFAIHTVGQEYDVVHVWDLLLFLALPVRLLPTKTRSRLFSVKDPESLRDICSHMIASAFASVNFPVMQLPTVTSEGKILFDEKPCKLILPKDFEESPYFDILKCPPHKNIW